ncbi:putative quinol monooxygenase [Pseudomonas sp. Je.1.5.c]|uniref:putative quinol monooxygenase n=1 Tax=Pseudomonas sp. Je.1.5.c TaxID=3142839 RepID=UPI003DAA1FFF
MPISIFATICPKPEHRDALEQALRSLVADSRAEPGNLRYDLFVREGDEVAFELFELYTDHAAIEAHRQSAHYQAYRATVADWLVRAPQVHLARPLDTAPFA